MINVKQFTIGLMLLAVAIIVYFLTEKLQMKADKRSHI